MWLIKNVRLLKPLCLMGLTKCLWRDFKKADDVTNTNVLLDISNKTFYFKWLTKTLSSDRTNENVLLHVTNKTLCLSWFIQKYLRDMIKINVTIK